MRASLCEKPVKDSVAYPAELCAAQFRAAFSGLASGVAVIAFDVGAAVHGLTATSLTPVSLDPPLALFCIGSESVGARRLAPGARAGISILGADQVDIARAFARPTPPAGYGGMERYAGVPVVDGALVVLAVDITELRPAGDHIVCFCTVTCAKSVAHADDPLVYHSRRYRRLCRLDDEGAGVPTNNCLGGHK